MSGARRELPGKVRRVVVKVGSSIITDESLTVSEERIGRIAAAIHRLAPTVPEFVVVTSGAIAAGRAKAGLGRPTTIPQKQAMAALGQSRLMWAYETVFSAHARNVAQILLTLDDFHSRRRFINARNTLFTLLSWGFVPIVNENDTVAVDEIKFGDNDNLSALVTSLSEADLLIILSDVDGLHDANPATSPGARRIPEVARIDAKILAMAGGTGSRVGTGGMITKLQAAGKVVDLGVPVVIADGHQPGVIERIVAGEDVGTLFLPRTERMAGRKHWIRHTLRPRGTVVVDRGGTAAILQKGKSLLPVGVVRAEGPFRPGDAVRCVDPSGREFARGIARYSDRELSLIAGHRTDEIESILGYNSGDEVVHRDDMVIIPAAG
jgi:glutamate 5-kinase